jgi:phospholipid transport system substrate-binding protein
MLLKRMIPWMAAGLLTVGCAVSQAQSSKAPDVLIREVSTDVLDAVRADKSIK